MNVALLIKHFNFAEAFQRRRAYIKVLSQEETISSYSAVSYVI